MATNLQLVNRALMELGVAKVLTSDELTAAAISPAKVMAAAYPMALTDVASRFDFPATRVAVELTTDGAPTDTEYLYSFSLPADYGAFRYIATTEGFRYNEYRLEGTTILANESPLFLHYTAKVTDMATLPDYLFAPTAFYLASIVAKPITGEMTERDRMMQYFEKAFSQAKTRASQESKPVQWIDERTSGFLGAHNGYGDV